MENKLIITPKTKVSDLLETYPQLEDILIKHVPAFKKLKNPVLRKTVAKIANLQQASSIGNIKIEDLINLLRKEVGQESVQIAESEKYNTQKPEWFNENKVKHELDVREMLASGEHPVNQVIADLRSLDDDEIYKVTAPFIPAPLIDKATSLNLSHWIKKESDSLFFIYFIRKKA